MNIPPSLRAAQGSLTQIDGRGPFARGLVVGPRHLTGAIHCLNAWGTQAATLDGRSQSPLKMENFGDVGYWTFQDAMRIDPCITALPPIGTAVWQFTPAGVLRTSRISGYSAATTSGPWSYSAMLAADGPLPGTPIGGDSGSICWIRLDGKWVAIGQCSFWGGVVVAKPARPPADWPAECAIQIPPGAAWRDPWNWVHQVERKASDWDLPGESIEPARQSVFLPSKPSNRRVVGMFQEGDDGTDNVVLDVQCSFEPETVVVSGAGTDRWVYPDTRPNWIVRAVRIDPAKIRLFFKKSFDASTYQVVLDGMSATTVAPSASDAEIVTPPTINQSDIDDLRLANAKLAMDNADLRAAVQNEQAKSAALQAKIDSFREAINRIIK